MREVLKLLTSIIDNISHYFYYIVYLFYLLYIALYLGLDKKYEKFLLRLKTAIRIFIGLFLILHFNSLVNTKLKLTELDRRIILSSGLVIILDAGISALIEEKLQEYKDKYE
jgi:hypothetical protein